MFVYFSFFILFKKIHSTNSTLSQNEFQPLTLKKDEAIFGHNVDDGFGIDGGSVDEWQGGS
jgi:hypothetical protein